MHIYTTVSDNEIVYAGVDESLAHHHRLTHPSAHVEVWYDGQLVDAIYA